MKKSDPLPHAITAPASLPEPIKQSCTKNQQSPAEASTKNSFRILFAPGSDSLNRLDLQRALSIAKYLTKNCELQVSLNGYADPRGTDEYNNVLSIERSKSIKAALIHFGISNDRISIQGHGNRFSTAAKKDTETLRQERRVDIKYQ